MPAYLNGPNNTRHDFIPLDESRPRNTQRPIDIVVFNLMGNTKNTELQIAEVLGASDIPVRLTFTTTPDTIERSKPDVRAHINAFYWPQEVICAPGQRADGLVVTGVNPVEQRMELESFYPHIKRAFRWAEGNVTSSLLLCSGGQAGLQYRHGIERVKQPSKTSGIFDHQIVSDITGIAAGLPDSIRLPVSRWNEIPEDAVRARGLEVVLASKDAGVSLIVEIGRSLDGVIYPRIVTLLGHPEYHADALQRETLRDLKNDPSTPLPRNYFASTEPPQPVTETWVRSQPVAVTWEESRSIYTNWVKSIPQNTVEHSQSPYDVGAVPAGRRASQEISATL